MSLTLSPINSLSVSNCYRSHCLIDEETREIRYISVPIYDKRTWLRSSGALGMMKYFYLGVLAEILFAEKKETVIATLIGLLCLSLLHGLGILWMYSHTQLNKGQRQARRESLRTIMSQDYPQAVLIEGSVSLAAMVTKQTENYQKYDNEFFTKKHWK